jgi:hypothetical protein
MMFFGRGWLLKGCTPANGSLFDKGGIVPGDGEIS